MLRLFSKTTFLTKKLYKSYRQLCNIQGVRIIGNHTLMDVSYKTMEKEKRLLIAKVRIAKKCERFNDMPSIMMDIIATGINLTENERELLEDAFNTVINSRRTAVDNLVTVRNITALSPEQEDIIDDYIEKIEKEVNLLCRTLLNLIEKILLPNVPDAEAEIFYTKIKADQYRHMAETSVCSDRGELIHFSRIAYEKAYHLSRYMMPPQHPLRMGTALNYSVFLHDIMQQDNEGCNIAKQAINEIWRSPQDEHLLNNKYLDYMKHNLHIWKRDWHENMAILTPTQMDINVEKAVVAYKSQRYDDAVSALEFFVEMKLQLNRQERELLVSSFKSALDQRRMSLQKLAIYQNYPGDGRKTKRVKTRRRNILKQYIFKIKKEMERMCLNMSELLNKYILPNTADSTLQVSYLTFEGEYYKCLCELNVFPKINSGNAIVAFEKASLIAKVDLTPVHLETLELMMKYSVFMYEIMYYKQKAILIAREALFNAETTRESRRAHSSRIETRAASSRNKTRDISNKNKPRALSSNGARVLNSNGARVLSNGVARVSSSNEIRASSSNETGSSGSNASRASYSKNEAEHNYFLNKIRSNLKLWTRKSQEKTQTLKRRR